MQLSDPLFPQKKDSPTVRAALVAAIQLRDGSARRDRELAADLDRVLAELADDATTKDVRTQVNRVRDRLLAALASDDT